MRSLKISEMTRVKTHRSKIQEFLIDTLFFVISGILYSIAINYFLSKNNILNGGFTGIATILNFLFGLPIGTVIFIMNIPLFFIAFRKLGVRFVLRTIWATFINSIFIDLGAFLPVYQNDLLLSSLFGGALVGLALGIIFIRNATTGGVDIIAKLIKLKFPHISIGRSILLFDACIVILGGIVYRNIESILYAAVVIFVSAQVLDYVIFGVSRGAMILIISEQSEKLCNMIINDLDRGVTILKAQGGYSKNDKDVLLCACFDNQTHKLIKKIKSVDEAAFFIVTQSKQILGKGFKNI